MKERPMLLCGPMVRAVKERRKTQTRRVVKFAHAAIPSDEHHYMGASDQAYAQILSQYGVAQFGCDGDAAREDNTHLCAVRCPYGVPGDRLWVRETFWQAGSYPCTMPSGEASPQSMNRGGLIHYAADGDPPNVPNRHYPNGLRGGAFSAPDPYASWEKRPSIHMPRWASRILLEVMEVRVERVQEISEEEAKQEGLSWVHPTFGVPGIADSWHGLARDSFAGLWDSINATRGYSWEMNPWVWVIGFKLLEVKT